MTNLLSSFSADRRTRLAALWTALFSLLSQGFRWFNTSFNHDSLVIPAGGALEVSIGRYLIPALSLLRGRIAAPLLIAFTATAFLILANSLLVRILDIRKPLHIALLCAIISASPLFTVLNATFIYCLDVHTLAIFLCFLSVWLLLRFKWGWLLATVPLAMALALYPSYLETLVVLLWLLAVKDLILNRNDILQPRQIGRVIAFLALGGIIYYAGWWLSVRLFLGTAASANPSADAYNSLNRLGDFRIASLPGLLKGTYWDFFRYILRPETLHPRLLGCLNLAVAAGSCILIAMSARKKKHLIPIAALFLVLPLAADFVFILSGGMVHTLMVFSIILLFSGAILTLEFSLPEGTRPAKRRFCRVIQAAITVCLCIITVNFTVFANQTHVKKALEDQATLSTLTRVLDRIETTEGYQAGITHVVFVGDLNKSAVSQHRNGYDTNADTFWKKESFNVTYLESYAFYFNHVLAYPIILEDRDTTKRYSQMDEVIEMPAFPAPGCTRMVGDVLVVKLSDNMSLQSSSEKNQHLSDGY